MLTAEDLNEEFNRYYRDHVRKLLLVRGAARYLAKGNYNVSRIEYLLRLFPDARFFIPVRQPLNHIASLAKQHRFFVDQARLNPRVGQQLTYAGHWEFGPDRRFVNFGDQNTARQISDAWEQGDEVLGWALYWTSTYGHVERLRQSLGDAAKQLFVFRYEDYCSDPATMIPRMLEHARLDPGPFAGTQAKFCERLSLPDYYQPDFNADERAMIDEICGPLARKLGYA